MDDLLNGANYGGYKYDDEDNEDNVDDEDEDFFAGGYNADDIMKIAGGKKEENENTFCVESTSHGSYQGGRFVSTSAYNAAKKAATAIFKNVDKEMGVVKQDKGKKAAKGAKNHLKKIEFVLYRHDKKKPVKYYKYEAERVQADVPVVVTRTINKGKSNEREVSITFSQKVSIHPVELDAEYVERNKEEQKIFAAKKRAAKRKAELAANPEKKQRKPKAAAKAKKTKKIASIEDVIKALTVPSKKAPRKALAAKAEKKPKADAKKPKAEKKPKAAKKSKAVKGGGFCSFF
jgi:hypothetical protein